MEHKASAARSELEQLLVDETAAPRALQLSLLEDVTGDFSHYQEIGSGGFAVVYKGILGDRVVAVKKLSDAFMDETKFHREVECLMRVKHKNVVRFLGYCADRQGNMERYNGKLVMADVHQRLLCFEYIPKGSLDKYIIDPHREWEMCYKIINGICEGLQSLHDNHIVHLDLKPANILLDDNMEPKITDFGLSRCFNENQSRDITGSIVGTMGYLAPELRDGGIITRSADLYSLGVIIIEILTGQKGYQATEDVLESWRGRLERSQQETLCEQIRACYETAVECRDFNPMKRPASAQNIIDRLRHVESIQEGHKPHCIISPNLNVGGILDEKASNGNTGILINGREITKSELKILKLAGVQCGKTHIWLNADGTYQKTVEGKILVNHLNILVEPIVKLLSPVLSLPTLNKAANQCGDEAASSKNRPEYLKKRTIQKLLLVGSGTSTILKQAKFSYKSKGFSMDECEDLKLIIQSNIYRYLGTLLEGCERFEDEVLADRRKINKDDPSSSGHSELELCAEVTEYSIVTRLKAFSDWILQAMAVGNLEDIFPAASREYAPLVEELWKDPAIQATYRRRSELPFLPSAASYFLDRVVDISRTEYELCDMDILYADGITSSDGLASTDISFPQLALDVRVDEPDPQDTMLRYQLIRISNKGLRENSKWLQMFDDVRLVIFCVAVSDYDEYHEDVNGTIVNKMVESRQLFESLALHQTFEQMDFLLLLTKFDLLEQKIGKSPLTACDWFSEFTPLVSRNLINGSSSRSTRSSNTGASLAQMAAHYIGTKFKRLFHSLTQRKLYVSYVNAMDQESVCSAIRYGREIVKWEEEKPVFNSSETVYSGEEPSSYSH